MSTETETEPKAGLWKRLRGGATEAGTISATLRDVLFVTYAVPPERVRPLLPEGFAPDILLNASGEVSAFVQTVVCYCEYARWSPLPDATGLSFYQVAHRVLVRQDGRKGVFLLRASSSTGEAHTAQRGFCKETEYARFTVHIGGNPLGGARGYEHFTVRAASDKGLTTFDAAFPKEPLPVPAPFGSALDMSDFLLRRDDWYFPALLPPKSVSIVTAKQGAYTPALGELKSARVSFWVEKEILTPDELLAPQSVLLLPLLTVSFPPPRRFKEGKEGADKPPVTLT